MSIQSTSWGSRLVAAHLRGEVSAAELWQLLLAHVDHPQADDLVDRLLMRFRRLLEGAPSNPQTVDEDVFIVAEDERELLAG